MSASLGFIFQEDAVFFFSEVYLKAGKRNTFLFLNSAILVEDPVLIGQMNIREYFKGECAAISNWIRR